MASIGSSDLSYKSEKSAIDYRSTFIDSIEAESHFFIPGNKIHNTIIPDDSNTASSSPVKASAPSSSAAINPALNRESRGCYAVFFYCTLFVLLDFWKQLTSYGMKYYNGGTYPIPQTQIVALAEACKFAVFFFLVVMWEGLSQLKLSFWFAVPSIIYAFNNNLYYFALHYTTPPVWSILIQLRIPLTALVYRLIFKRYITAVQWLALGILVIAVAASNYSGNQTLQGITLVPALGLAIIGSITSVIGALVMEFLFKNDSRSFNEMQTQLYFFGSLAAWSMYTVEIITSNNQKPVIKGSYNLIYGLICSDIILTCISGFIVALIIKRLDNIVKLYSQSLSNIFTAIACSIVFSDHFHLNTLFIICLFVVFVAIFLYESKELGPSFELMKSLATKLTNSPVRRCLDKLYRKFINPNS